MPRKPRVDVAGYHLVINKGVAGRKIFYEDDDCEKFLEIVCTSAKLYDFTVHSYCLLNDHYHLLVETKEENISLALRYINSNYAIFFNKKYKRSGHLWQGRYRSWYILNKSYIDKLVLYIEQHPLKCHLCEKLEDFKYSSYRSFVNLDNPIECLKRSFMFEKYPKIDEVKAFFDVPVMDKKLKNIIDELQKVVSYKKNLNNKKHKSLEEHFSTVLGKKERNQKIYEAYLDGYTQNQIAAFLNISQPTVSNSIKKLLQTNKPEIICI